MYLTASSTISYQLTFQNQGFSDKLEPLHPDSVCLHPDYGPLIPPMKRRRMTDVLKMGIACAKDCLEQANIEQPGAIMVGTSLGCNTSTKNFLDNIAASQDKLLSPTSFIISTHNTIAGQISLLLKNTAYNMTHTQNSLSFEHALTDAVIYQKEGADHILVGAADGEENELYNLNSVLDISGFPIACGASFFLLSKHPFHSGSVMLRDVKCAGLVDDPNGMIRAFLLKNDVIAEDLDYILFSASQSDTYQDLEQLFPVEKLFKFQKYSGVYLTNSAFALHLGGDLLASAKKNSQRPEFRKALIINNLIRENLGLILIELA